jgi:hypothetical protein
MLPMTSHEYGCDAGRLRHDLEGAAVRLVVDGFAALVLDDVALRVEFLQVERIEQEPHAIGLEPQGRFEVIRRHCLVIGRPIVRSRPVVRAADAFSQPIVDTIRDVPGAGEHHVLEQVRKAGAARRLVLGSDVIPDVDGHGGRRPIDRRDNGQPIRQGVGLERDLDRGRALCQGGNSLSSRQQSQCRGGPGSQLP